jgi:hypothetical protein
MPFQIVMSVLSFLVISTSLAADKSIKIVDQVTGPNQFIYLHDALAKECKKLTEKDWLKIELNNSGPTEVLAFQSNCNVEMFPGPNSSGKLTTSPLMQGNLVMIVTAGFKLHNLTVGAPKDVSIQFFNQGSPISSTELQPIELSQLEMQAGDEVSLVFQNVNRPVFIKNTTFFSEEKSANKIGFMNVMAPIEIKGILFSGEMKAHASGPVTIQDSILKVAENARTTVFDIQGSVVNVTDTNIYNNSGLALLIHGLPLLDGTRVKGNVTVTGGRIDGGVSLSDGGFLRSSGITFGTATTISDAGEGSGLQNDPLKSNHGLHEDQLSSRRDFNSNDCADYPREGDVKDESGDCINAGIPVAPMN